MYFDPTNSDLLGQGNKRHSPHPCATDVLGPSRAGAQRGGDVIDPVDESRWLQSLTVPGAPPWQQRLAEAISLMVDELERGPGPVELIIAPSSWHGWVDYVIVRPLRQECPARLRVLSLNDTELSLYSLRTREVDPEPPRRSRRRSMAPVRLSFDLAQVVEPATPSRLDLLLYVTHRVRQNYGAIERA
jgi:hypothetical protein